MDRFSLQDLAMILAGIAVVAAISMEIPQILWSFAKKRFLYYVEVRRVTDDKNNNQNDAPSATTTPTTVLQQNPATRIATPATDDRNDSKALLFAGQVDALAKFVVAKKIGETDGIKLVFGVSPSSSNKTYIVARDMLHDRLDKLKFATLNEQQKDRWEPSSEAKERGSYE